MNEVPLRVAIAHDYLTQRGGAERVVLALSRMFPDAVIHTTLYNPDTTYPEFAEKTVVSSTLNRSRFLRTHHRHALPLLPLASSSMRIDDVDVVIASSSGWAHGFRSSAPTLVYCHSPARWLYRSDDYLGDEARRVPGRSLRLLKPALLAWDKRAAKRADRYVANATVIQQRIRDAYGFDVDVVWPPVSVNAGGAQEALADIAAWAPQGYLLLVSRLLPYKHVDIALEAMRGRPEKLLVVGAGPMLERLRSSAPDNVRILSNLTDAQLRWAYAHCGGVVAPSFEDFGLTPVEAGAFGKPVAALRGGGYLDTVTEDVTGIFFDVPDALSISEALDRLRERTWNHDDIVEHSELFSEERFAERLGVQLNDLLGQWRSRKAPSRVSSEIEASPVSHCASASRRG